MKLFQLDYRWNDAPRFLGLTLFYALLAKIMLVFSSESGNITILWIPGGVALAALLAWGKKFTPAVFLGALIAGIRVGDQIWLSSLIALGNCLESWFAAWLLTRRGNFDLSLGETQDFIKIGLAAAASAVISAVIGPLALLQAGVLGPQRILLDMMHWWQADFLGIIMGAPLLLVWRKWPDDWFSPRQIFAIAGFLVIACLAGGAIFLDWFSQTLGPIGKGYWMFLLVVWAAVKYGRHGALLIVTLTSVLALAGVAQDTGIFADDLALTHLQNFWFYMLVLTAVGLSLAINIESRKNKEAEHQKAYAALSLIGQVFESTLEGIVITDANCDIIDANRAFTLITGYTREEALGKNPRFLKSGRQDGEFYTEMWRTIESSGHWSGELWNCRKDGSIYPEWMTISAITDKNGVVSNYVGISSDITLLKEHEKQLEHIAHYDALTGIPNRVLLMDRMQQALAKTRRARNKLAIGYLDLDGFKPINDELGHEAGDKVLIEIAQRISRTLRGGDTVARLGGDEFVILLLGIEDRLECHTTLDRLLKVIAAPIVLYERSYAVTVSIGVTLYPDDDEDPDTLLRHADQAMYLAKQKGKNRHVLFDPDQEMQLKIFHEQRRRIEQGLLHNEFELYYQPKVAMFNHKMVGVEALIRWRHPQRGLLAPDQFLNYIENAPSEIVLGEWVIDTALAQLQEWLEAGQDPQVSINISVNHLQSAGFIESLRHKLSRRPMVTPHRLEIEILETAALTDVAAVAALINQCAEFGVGFALDDFGTGYSSLSYLRRLPANTLKIDLSFVRDMLTDKEDRAIVKGVIALAHTFNRVTVAEGVESLEHFEVLRDMGCDIGQGYGIARPMPASEIAAWRADYESSHEAHAAAPEFGASRSIMAWDEKFAIGHAVIDAEHKTFLELIVEFKKEVDGQRNPRRIDRQLREIREYAVFHFLREENILEEMLYHDLETIRILHRRFLDALQDKVVELGQGQADYHELCEFLFEWFTSHVLREDKRIALFLDPVKI